MFGGTSPHRGGELTGREPSYAVPVDRALRGHPLPFMLLLPADERPSRAVARYLRVFRLAS